MIKAACGAKTRSGKPCRLTAGPDGFCRLHGASDKQDDLPEKYARFVQEYLIDLNATKAYMRVYPDASYETANANGTRLMSNPAILEAIAEGKRALAERADIAADDVVRELALIGFADLTDFVEWDGQRVKLKNSADLDPTKRRAIVEVSQGQHGIKIKLADKKGSLDSLGRHLGIFEKDNAQQGKREHTFTPMTLDQFYGRNRKPDSNDPEPEPCT